VKHQAHWGFACWYGISTFWRIPALYLLKLSPLPHLRGTWKIKGNIFHLPNDPPPNETQVQVNHEAPEGYIVIRQTGSGFRFTALWNSGNSSTMKHLSPVTGYDNWGTFVGHYQKRDGGHVGIAGAVVYDTTHPSEPQIYYTTIEEKPQRGVVKMTEQVRQLCSTYEEATRLPTDAKRTLSAKLQFLIWLR
jgi:hypothetical protein